MPPSRSCYHYRVVVVIAAFAAAVLPLRVRLAISRFIVHSWVYLCGILELFLVKPSLLHVFH